MEDLKSKVVSGASWMVATQWAMRFAGLISTAVLARVLTPADFGTVAAILALVSVIDAFFEFGFDYSIIREDKPGRDLYDTVWTLRIIKMLVTSAMILGLAPFLADYSETEHIVEMALFIAASTAITGFSNIGLIKFHKELEIHRIFKASVAPKLLGVVTNIALALYLRSFWALIYGQLALSIYSLIISYWVSDFRPKLCLSKTREVWDFSKWMFLKNLSRQLFVASDRLVLSGLVDKAKLGTYTVSADVASIFSAQLFGPAGRVLTPAISKIKNEETRLRRVFRQAVTTFIALVAPAGVGVWLVSEEVAVLVLGDQWAGAGELLSLMALFFAIFIVARVISNAIAILGLQRFSSLLCLGQTCLYFALIFPVFHSGGIKGVIFLKLGLQCIELLALMLVSVAYFKLSISCLCRDIARSVCATAVLFGVVMSLPGMETPVTSLLIKSSVGAATYLGVSFALWRIQGCPVGFESLSLEYMRKRISSVSVTAR